MFVGYTIETLRAEAPLHAASTPAAEAVLAAGYRNDVGESNEAMACTPRLGLPQAFRGVMSEDAACRGTSSLCHEIKMCKRPPSGSDKYKEDGTNG